MRIVIFICVLIVVAFCFTVFSSNGSVQTTTGSIQTTTDLNDFIYLTTTPEISFFGLTNYTLDANDFLSMNKQELRDLSHLINLLTISGITWEDKVHEHYIRTLLPARLLEE